jgi:adenylate cyclase
MAPGETYKRRLAAIAFADVAGWSRLIEQNDAATLTAWKVVRSQLIEPKIHEHSGRLLEIAGDAVLVEFPSAVAAVSWALDIQKGLAEQNATATTAAPFRMRIGVNVEDVIVDGDRLVGDGVNVAARIQQLAEPGDVIITKAVHDYIQNKLPVSLDDLGERRVKNISRTLRLYRVRLDVGSRSLVASEHRARTATANALLMIESSDAAAGIDIEEMVEAGTLPYKPARKWAAPGGAVMLEFHTAREAAGTAFAIQGARRPGPASALRMGIEIDGKSVAAYAKPEGRLSTLAGPEEILVSAEVRDQLVDGLDAWIEDLGERPLSAARKKVRTFRVSPRQSTGAADHMRRGDRPSIAVVPFANMSGDPANDYLGDLIAEDVIGHLSRQVDLTVISRLSTAAFRGRSYEPLSVAEALNVRYVVSGSLYASGSRLRISADLSEAGTGHVVWAERFEGSVTDIFELQDQLAKAISRRLVPHVRQLELQRARSALPESLTAYERTLRAIDHFHHSSQRDLEDARLLLESAIEADPSYVTPYAWLAHWYVRRIGQGWSDNPQRDIIEANRYADTALQKDPTDAQALTVSGLVVGYLNKDLESAIELHNRALTINPSSASAWLWSTSAYAWLGDGAEAVQRAHRAIELSPFDPQMYMFTSIAGTAHAVAGVYDKAIDHCKRSMRLNRMFASTHRILTLSLWLSGREPEAREAARELLKLEPTLTASGFLRRFPGSDSPQARVFAEALSAAGVPQ